MNTKNLLELAEKADVSIGWINKNTHGTADLKTQQIWLNPESMVVEVFIHELMHIIHPMLNREEDEEVIDELTARVWKKLTTQQIRAIAKKLLERR